MTVQEAYQILGLPLGTGKKEIKKKYRKLMMQVHPDVTVSLPENYRYGAQEINSAYAVLIKEKPVDFGNCYNDGKQPASGDKKNAAWGAPVNENAFMEREVLQYVEDYDGSVLGTYCVARGKYLWVTDEDFPLFLLSMCQCSKELLDGMDEKVCRYEISAKRQQIQAELTYLLAQQFIDASTLLAELAQEEMSPNGDRIFCLSSMLETTGRRTAVKAGEAVYPSGIRDHRLYLENQAGEELGYLSFTDDRLYYLVIPLFEQKRAQVKIRTAETKEKSHRAAKRCQKLHLWVKLLAEDSRMPENLNLQIEKLLADYSVKA